MLGLFPPSSRVSFFRLVAPAASTISLPTSVEPVNATLSTSMSPARAAPAVSPNPGTTLTTPSGTPASAISSASRSAVSGVCSAGLSTTQCAGGQRRPELPRRHQQREVPRDDLPDHADRLAQRVGVEVGARHVRHRDVNRVALDLGGPARHVVEQVGGQRHIGRLGDSEWLAVVQRLQLGELVGVLQDEVADPPDDAAPLGRGHPAPRPLLERLARGPDSPVDVLGAALGDPGERLPGGGVGRLERLARRRIGPLPVDEQLPGGGDECLDVAVQGHGHGCSSPLLARRPHRAAGQR